MTNTERFHLLLKELEKAGVATIRIEALEAELRPKYELIDKRVKEQEEALDSSLKAIAGWLGMHDISVREAFMESNATVDADEWEGVIVGYMKEGK